MIVAIILITFAGVAAVAKLCWAYVVFMTKQSTPEQTRDGDEVREGQRNNDQRDYSVKAHNWAKVDA